ncbi:MAG TPA: hypothetical protein VK116_12500, partial [Planctomycetota bacterium]|nr:hypothetical protein [Planctomycetota bacterium]
PRHLAVSPGIHAGGDDEQATAAWVRWIVSKRPDLTIHSLPYRYGGVFDTIWSLFGLSRGSAYAAAEELVFERGVRPGEEVLGFGFSGGVERMVGASRALRIAGIPVVSVTGAAGPWTGGVPTRSARVHLSENPFADPVVMTTRLVQGVFFWAPSNVEVRTVAEAEGHETPAFPDGRTRAPAAAYLPGFAEAIDWRLGAR